MGKLLKSKRASRFLLSRNLLVGLGMMMAMVWPGAAAHEQAIGLTEILLIADEAGNCPPQACRIEVAHRLSIHDAESTLMNVLGARADLVGNLAAQDRFVAYVAERFAIGDGVTGDPIELSLLGGEVERGYFWIYQEAELDRPLTALMILQGVLMDAIPQQTNRVNIRRGDQIETLVFSADPGPQSLHFDQVTAP